MTSVVRNILWAVLFVLALLRGLTCGQWKVFVFLTVLFVMAKGMLLVGQIKLRRSVRKLEQELNRQGKPSFVPEPDLIESMTVRAAAISDEIKRLCPPQPCLRFAIDYDRKPTPFDSKLGGVPYWDDAKPYPTDTKGRPMAMVFQVNFEHCPPVGLLPKEGMLQFFISSDEEVLEEGYGEDYDNPTSQADFRVVYHSRLDCGIDTRQLEQYPRCETLKYTPVSGEYAVDVELGESCVNMTCKEFSGLASMAVRNLYGDELEEMDVIDYIKTILPEEQRDDVDEGIFVGDNPMYRGVGEDNFQMLGFPAFEQFDERGEDDPHDTLLLQIPTIDTGNASDDSHRFHTIWGDCGSARLFISSDKLRRCDFGSVYFETQCY